MSTIALFPLGFDSQLVSHWDYGHGKWCSSIVSNEGSRATYLVTAQHRVLVIRGVLDGNNFGKVIVRLAA